MEKEKKKLKERFPCFLCLILGINNKGNLNKVLLMAMKHLEGTYLELSAACFLIY